MMRKKVFRLSVLGLLGMLFWGCGLISNTSSNSTTFSSIRRVYVNDSAANDSLPTAIANSKAGIFFILQPNRNYSLRVSTLSTGDQLDVYLASGNYLKYWGTLNDSAGNGAEFFNVHSDQSVEGLFAGLLVTPDGAAAAAKRINRIRLLPLNPTKSNSLSVHLFVVGKFKYIADGNRSSIASSLLTKLKSIYASYGVTMTTSYEIIDTGRVSMPFGPTFVNLPGKRIAKTAHLYFVDSIYQVMASDKEILGYSPREVVNIDTNPESRVILSSRLGSVDTLATVAAHELGHFFGLRHTTTTSNDLTSDKDFSNVEDGLTSTLTCSSMPLSKKSALPPTYAIGPGGKPYCLFVAGGSPGCPSVCDLSYLMFAYYCNDQRVLTSEQQTILRQNMALIQR